MAEKSLGTVRDVANRIVAEKGAHYDSDLLKLLSDELLGTELIDENLYAVSREIDQVRFDKEGYLMNALLSIPEDWQDKECGLRMAREVINTMHPENLPEEERQIVKEIKFLNKLALTVAHQ